MDELKELVRKAFATTYGFVLVAECYHWNVEDENFLMYHELFGDMYEDVESKLDKFAEEIRGIGAYAPATFLELAELSSIKEDRSDVRHTAQEMVKYLWACNSLVKNDLMAAYTVAEREKKHGLSSFLAKRLGKHHKYGWMLYSSIKA